MDILYFVDRTQQRVISYNVVAKFRKPINFDDFIMIRHLIETSSLCESTLMDMFTDVRAKRPFYTHENYEAIAQLILEKFPHVRGNLVERRRASLLEEDKQISGSRANALATRKAFKYSCRAHWRDNKDGKISYGKSLYVRRRHGHDYIPIC